MRRVADPPGTPVRGFRFGRVAAFKSEPRPASFRNGGRHQIGMPGRNASEFAPGVPGLVPNPRFARRDPAGRVPFPRQCANINLAGVGGLRPDAVVKPKIAERR